MKMGLKNRTENTDVILQEQTWAKITVGQKIQKHDWKHNPLLQKSFQNMKMGAKNRTDDTEVISWKEQKQDWKQDQGHYKSGIEFGKKQEWSRFEKVLLKSFAKKKNGIEKQDTRYKTSGIEKHHKQDWNHIWKCLLQKQDWSHDQKTGLWYVKRQNQPSFHSITQKCCHKNSRTERQDSIPEAKPKVCLWTEDRQLFMKGASQIDNTRPNKAKRKERTELSKEQNKQLQHNITHYAYMVQNLSSTTPKFNNISSISQQKKTKRKKYSFEEKRQNEDDTMPTNNKCNICLPHPTVL